MPTQSKNHEWTDEYTLLCEKCGYVIEGLDTNGNCPECGKPIVESLPERRVGTPWQQAPGLGSLMRTWWMTLLHPLRTLDVMRIEDAQSRTLTQITAVSGLPLWPLVMLLTSIEARGLRLFGKQNGSRISYDLSRTICAHGSVGWIIVFLGLWIGACIVLIGLGTSMDYYFNPNYSSKAASRIIGLGIGLSIPVMLSGFLFFETFAYLGLRRCKYANRVRPESQSQGATTRVEDAQ